MKTVAVVGAGPGGLVAAKTLIHHPESLFEVTIFERSSQLGGLWNLSKNGSGSNGFLSPQTPTNLSKFTVGFSDLSWDSIDLGLPTHNNQPEPNYSCVPMFPKAWMAGQYLELYAEKYGIKEKVQFSHEVIQTERFQKGDSFRWRISTRKGDNHGSKLQENIFEFDYLIVASGFFSLPRSLPSSLSPKSLPPRVKILHSSQYRTIDDLIPKHTNVKSTDKILIVGGGNSAGEVAGTIAHHLSSAIYDPNSRQTELKHVKIFHVTPRPLYALPPFVPAPTGKEGFIPLDLRLYDFDTRPGNIESYAGKAPDEAIPMVHGFIRNMIGGDQADLGATALVSNLEDGGKASTAYVALSESYPEFVRSGLIQPVTGRVRRLQLADDKSNARLCATFDDPRGVEQEIDGIVAVVHASGYTPAPALSWLPADVLEHLEYDPTAHRLPLILDKVQTMNTNVPDIAFIGFYEGPYWGVMEMQARLVTETWAQAAQGKSFEHKERAYEGKDVLRGLRQGMEAKHYNVPQYWLSDYLGYMEESAIDLHLRQNHHLLGEHQGPTSPARYLSSEAATNESNKTLEALYSTILASQKGAFVARATFRALQGHWKLNRRINSLDSNLPSGSFVGEASLHPRTPTQDVTTDKPEGAYDGEYLYSEQGTFMPDGGGSMQASRHYVYRYREFDDGLSVWFVKPDDTLTVDYLYHDFHFTGLKVIDAATAKQSATAEAEHLCVEDLYKTEYEFNFAGIAIHRWTCRHVVKGPAKDYVSDATYER